MAKILSICAKCSDLFSATLTVDGVEKATYDGYVLDYMPDEHWGDYVMLDIDIETGKIVNWKPCTVEEVLKDMDKG